MLTNALLGDRDAGGLPLVDSFKMGLSALSTRAFVPSWDPLLFQRRLPLLGVSVCCRNFTKLRARPWPSSCLNWPGWTLTPHDATSNSCCLFGITGKLFIHFKLNLINLQSLSNHITSFKKRSKVLAAAELSWAICQTLWGAPALRSLRRCRLPVTQPLAQLVHAAHEDWEIVIRHRFHGFHGFIGDGMLEAQLQESEFPM